MLNRQSKQFRSSFGKLYPGIRLNIILHALLLHAILFPRIYEIDIADQSKQPTSSPDSIFKCFPSSSATCFAFLLLQCMSTAITLLYLLPTYSYSLLITLSLHFLGYLCHVCCHCNSIIPYSVRHPSRHPHSRHNQFYCTFPVHISVLCIIASLTIVLHSFPLTIKLNLQSHRPTSFFNPDYYMGNLHIQASSYATTDSSICLCPNTG